MECVKEEEEETCQGRRLEGASGFYVQRRNVGDECCANGEIASVALDSVSVTFY